MTSLHPFWILKHLRKFGALSSNMYDAFSENTKHFRAFFFVQYSLDFYTWKRRKYCSHIVPLKLHFILFDIRGEIEKTSSL